jgi:hypothetical protein
MQMEASLPVSPKQHIKVNGLLPNNFAKAVVAALKAGAEAVSQLPLAESSKMEDVVEFESSDEEEMEAEDLLNDENDDDEEEEMPTLINISDDSDDASSPSEGSDVEQDDDSDQDMGDPQDSALDSCDQAMLADILSRDFPEEELGSLAPEEDTQSAGSSRKRRRETDDDDTDEEASTRRARR